MIELAGVITLFAMAFCAICAGLNLVCSIFQHERDRETWRRWEPSCPEEDDDDDGDEWKETTTWKR